MFSFFKKKNQATNKVLRRATENMMGLGIDFKNDSAENTRFLFYYFESTKSGLEEHLNAQRIKFDELERASLSSR